MKIYFIFMLTIIFLSCQNIDEAENMYSNPIVLEDEWNDYGIGDPFVLRHDGIYYLYASTVDTEIGIKYWTSTNLVDWNYAGLCATETLTKGAYAPEVIYYNGMFYMVTSPAGKGHYILKSESPGGPFIAITDNFGYAIDGSFYLDDDGQMYFYWASGNGIQGGIMNDFVTVNRATNLNAYMNYWTEGAMLIKRYGIYYLTYTGNHVFSKGYRVNYSTSRINPLNGFEYQDNNPILISVNDIHNGLGHSSTVLGPDMTSHYIVYHNLIGESLSGTPIRSYNLDRLVFNAEYMQVIGPTTTPIPKPKQPNYYTYLNEKQETKKWHAILLPTGEKVLLSPVKHESIFTSEFNFVAGTSCEVITFILGFDKQSDVYLETKLDTKNNNITLYKVLQSGLREKIVQSNISIEMNYEELHSLRIEKSLYNIYIYFDNMALIEIQKNIELNDGYMGYYFYGGNPIFSYVAFANSANGLSDFEATKIIPGSIEAIHHINNDYKNDASFNSNYNRNRLSMVYKKNEIKLYSVSVAEAGFYNVSAVLSSKDKTEANFSILVPGNTEQVLSIVGITTEFTHKPLTGNIALNYGLNTIGIVCDTEDIDIMHFKFTRISSQTNNITTLTSKNDIVSNIKLGNWGFFDTGYRCPSGGNGFFLLGDSELKNYEISVDIAAENFLELSEGGILVRAKNASLFKYQVPHSVTGYFVAIDQDKISLSRLNYNKSVVATYDKKFNTNEILKLTARCIDDTIMVYLNDSTTPIIKYTDKNAFLNGMAGLFSIKSDISYKNLTIQMF